MADYSELKRLAERVIALEATEEESVSLAWDEFDAAANPAAVLALIAENESLKGSCMAMGKDMGKVTRERNSARAKVDQLKAELEHTGHDHDLLRNEHDQPKAEVEALRKDAERYRWLKVDRRPASQLDAAFNTYGVPVDEAIDAAMIKEFGHD